MTAIDHAAEALRLVSWENTSGALRNVAQANVHAQLAIAEQQRIANLIAAFQMEGGPYKAANNWTDGNEDANVRLLRDIREGLGL